MCSAMAGARQDNIGQEHLDRVGPNAVVQLAHALRDKAGHTTMRQVFQTAGYDALIDNPPVVMIDERIPAAIFAALWQTVPKTTAKEIARDAGRRTADYVLAHRIPSFAQAIIRRLPPPLASPVLLSAIHKNAWTFAGSGRCRTKNGRYAVIEIERNPLAMPQCAWHQGVFERLFRELVTPDTRVRHTECCANDGRVCRFELHLN